MTRSGIALAFALAASLSAQAPVGRYLMARTDEVTLARSAAPAAIAGAAEVLVLGRDGYITAAKGSNGFVCLVKRSWDFQTSNAEFSNPKVRAPICYNPQAAASVLPVYLTKTRLALAGRTPAEIARALASGEPPTIKPGAMAYMMSPQAYLADQYGRWYPHLMVYVAGDAAKNSGANLPGSPLLAEMHPQEHWTAMLVLTLTWSDGSKAPARR